MHIRSSPGWYPLAAFAANTYDPPKDSWWSGLLLGNRLHGGVDGGVFCSYIYIPCCSRGHHCRTVPIDQKMRGHLVTCLEKKEFTPFPMLCTRKKMKQARDRNILIHSYCVCRMPYLHKLGDPEWRMPIFTWGCLYLP